MHTGVMHKLHAYIGTYLHTRNCTTSTGRKHSAWPGRVIKPRGRETCIRERLGLARDWPKLGKICTNLERQPSAWCGGSVARECMGLVCTGCDAVESGDGSPCACWKNYGEAYRTSLSLSYYSYAFNRALEFRFS